ncbi:unnamed protein product [Paramecium sonneborni]|uniref:Uncharacterized protein n=1 Tax=Paramecium sonneborni TaxID=65129 RepID=A0A8S1M055_9CILI|nr:unnamed protein product [Paramecium sonneborni]
MFELNVKLITEYFEFMREYLEKICFYETLMIKIFWILILFMNLSRNHEQSCRISYQYTWVFQQFKIALIIPIQVSLLICSC